MIRQEPKDKDKNHFETVTMFRVTCDASLPIEVRNEINELWENMWPKDQMGRMDRKIYYTYFHWDSDIWGDHYPVIDSFLKSHGVTTCLIDLCW